MATNPYSFKKRLKKATHLYEVLPLAHEAFYSNKIKLSEQAFLKAVTVAPNLRGYFEIYSDLFLLQNRGFQFEGISEVLSSLIDHISEKIDEVVLGDKGKEEEYYSQFNFSYHGAQLFEWGYESLAIKAFHFDIHSAENYDLCVNLGIAALLNDCQWDHEKQKAKLLLEELKVRIEEQLKGLEKSKFEKDFPYSIEDALKNAADLNWQSISQSLFDICILRYQIDWATLDEHLDFSVYSLLNDLEKVVNKLSLKTSAFPLNLLCFLIEHTSDKDDYFHIAEALGCLHNPQKEEELFNSILSKHPQFLELTHNSHLIQLIVNLSPSPLRNRLMTLSIDQAESPGELFELKSHINQYTDLQHFITIIDHKALESPYYLHGMIQEYFDKRISFEDIRLVIKQYPNAINTIQYNQTLLMYACYAGRPKVVKALIEAGADMNYTSADGNNALISSLISLDVKYGSHGTEIPREIIFKLLHSGVNVNQTYEGTTALIEAACDGYLDVVKALYEMGASFEYENDRGAKALMRAAYTGKLKVLQYLLSIGCDASTLQDVYIGLGPGYGSWENHGEVVLLLEKAGANILRHE